MKHLVRAFRFALFIGISGLLVACSKTPEPLALPANARILAFGDSLTYGTGASPNASYPARLQAYTGYQVINAGVPGETTAQGLKRLPQLLSKHHPDLVILIHGGNDFLRKYPIEQTRANLLAMIRLIRESGSQVLLVAVPQPALLLADAPLYAAIAQETQVPLLENVLSKILQYKQNKSDLIHPNARGYDELARAIQARIQP